MKKRDAEIYRLRKAGMTMPEIGKIYGISRSRVSQLLFRAERQSQQVEKIPVNRAEFLQQSVNDLLLPSRVISALMRGGYCTLGDILIRPAHRIPCLQDFGPVAHYALQTYLEGEGLRLGMSMPDVVAWCNNQKPSKKRRQDGIPVLGTAS